MAKFILIFTLILITPLSEVFAFDLKQESRNKDWLNRLFYVDGRSLVINSEFFVAKNGRYSPEKELLATVELLKTNPQSFACKFPGRFRYLAPKLGIDTKKFHCADFELWFESFEASGISIMFASQYLENPASSFGHTYLKINSDKKSLYLTKAINFAASVPDDVGAIAYAWKGITGGFPGKFNLVPFYILFQEYANMEQRDLWEYELTLNKEQSEKLLETLFEILHHAKFDYFFVSENCSSLLLRLIDVEAKKNLLDQMPYQIIPIETVKVLDRNHLLKSTHFHPSITTRMTIQSKNMTHQQVKKVVDYIDHGKKLDGSASPQALDLSLEYLNYKRQKYGGVFKPEQQKDFDQYLLMRSKHTETYETPEVKALDPIKTAHQQRLTIGMQGEDKGPGNFTLAYRPVGKDFFDRPNGYAKESEINFLKTKMTFNRKDSEFNKLNIDVIGIKRYADYSLINKTISWGANLTFTNAYSDCLQCYYAEGDGFGGLGKNILGDFLLTYLVFHPMVRVGNFAKSDSQFLPQAELGFIHSEDKYVFKSSISDGWKYDHFSWNPFIKMNLIFSWILNDSFSLNFTHDYLLEEKTNNRLEGSVSYYF